MLCRIEIHNFALIAELFLDLGEGINIFTGETGAGKSILLDALAFLLGSRVQPSVIRSGCERMSVSGIFELPRSAYLEQVLREHALRQGGDPEDDFLVDDIYQFQLWRELHRNGRTQARLNGRPITVAALRALGGELLEMQGQQETLTLIQPRRHLSLLDQFGDEEHQQLYRSYQQLYDTWQSKEKQRQDLLEREREANRSQDLWRFQHEEIEEVGLEEDEDEQLEQRLRILQAAQRLESGVGQTLDLLLHDQDNQDSASTQLFQARRELEGISRYDERFQPFIELLESLYWQLDELGRDLSSYLTELEADPQEQEAIEDRLEQIKKLKRKYGASIADVLAYRDEIRLKLDNLEEQSDNLRNLETECQKLRQETILCGEKLSRSRRKTAEYLETALQERLWKLMMPECRFIVEFQAGAPDEAQREGLEGCEFLIAPNPGEPPKPLAKIASGGELARILMALKSALVALDAPDILVFDEPDTGLSGAAVRAMAIALAKLGQHCQLLIVTHQAVVAATAAQHYLIEKKVENEQTYTFVQQLDHDGRCEEIMRLLSADKSSASARQHAENLLREASQFLAP